MARKRYPAHRFAGTVACCAISAATMSPSQGAALQSRSISDGSLRLASFKAGAGFAQRHATAAIGHAQAKERGHILYVALAQESTALARRPLEVKIRRQVRPHLLPDVQKLVTNHHPNLESHWDSWRPALNLTPMRVAPTSSSGWHESTVI